MKPDFKILDGLRGIAATYVVINHCRGNLLIGGKAYSLIKPISHWTLGEKSFYSVMQLTALGREFVIFFFVLSGFSIAHSLSKTTSVAKFYKKRVIRLYPPYLTALCWAFLVFSLLNYLSPQLNFGSNPVFYNTNYIVCNLFYIPKGAYISQFWSLTFEVIFYLIVPFVILKRKMYYLFSAILYGVSFFITWKTTTGTSIATMYLFDYNFYFVIGIFLYFNYHRIKKLFLIGKIKLLIFSLFTIILMSVIKFLTYDENKITIFISALLSLVLIVNFLEYKIQSRLTNFLGSMSYTIYIIHLASIFLFKGLLLKFNIVNLPDITSKWLWIAGILFCILTSYIFYLICERPTRYLLKQIRNAEPKRPTLTTPQ